MDSTANPYGSPRIVVVGPCASGKSTLVGRLLNAGYDARVVAQEHSAIRDLWAKRHPDIVIGLDLDLETLRSRRSPDWSAEVYARQHERLRSAFEAADLIIDTAEHDADDVVDMVIEILERNGDRYSPLP